MIVAHHLLLCGVSASALMGGSSAPTTSINALFYATSVASVSPSAWSLVPTHAVAHDELGVSYGGADKIRIPASLNGKRVRICAGVECDGNFTMEIRKNGSTFPGTGSSTVRSAGNSRTHATSAFVTVTTGDEFEVYAKSLSGTLSSLPTGVWVAIEVASESFSGARISASANITSNNTIKEITFGVEDFDIGGWYDPVLKPNRLVVPSGVSLVRVSGGCRWPNSGGQLILGLFKDGSNVFDGSPTLDTEPSVSTEVALTLCSGPIAVSPGNEISLTTYSTNTLTVVPSDYRWMMIEELPSDLRYAMLKKSSNQTVAGATTVAIIWESVVADTDGMYSAGNPTRLTVPAGVTKVRLSAGLQRASQTLQAVMKFAKNGDENFVGSPGFENDTAGGDFLHISSAVLDVVPGDYFEVNLFCNAGSSTVNANQHTYFSMEEVTP